MGGLGGLCQRPGDMGAKVRRLSRRTPRRKRVSTLVTPGRVTGGVYPRVYLRWTINSAVFALFSAWLLSKDRAFTLSSSSWMEGVLDSGTTRVTSSAYFIYRLPGVTVLRSLELMMNIAGPRAEPCTI